MKKKIRFRKMAPGDACFRPVEQLYAVEAAGRSKPIGFIERTYRNQAGRVPGKPHWQYRLRQKHAVSAESGISADDLIEKVRLLYETRPASSGEGTGSLDEAQDESGASGSAPMPMVRLYIGLRRNHAPVPVDAVVDWLRQRLESFTYSECGAVYRGVDLPSLRIEYATRDVAFAEQVAIGLAHAFGQETVGLEAHGVYCRMRYAAQKS